MARILIAEKSSFMKGALKYLLGHGGHAVVGTAEDAAATLEMFKRFKPDLVFCDLAMGGAGGLPILKAIKEEDPGARVIMVYGFGQGGKEEAKKLGAAGFVEKPYRFAEVLEVVKKVVQTGQA